MSEVSESDLAFEDQPGIPEDVADPGRADAALPVDVRTELEPLLDRLIVEPIEEDTIRGSGIIVPDVAKEKPQQGKVLAVGPGRVHESTGRYVKLHVEVGDVVLYSKYGGTELTVDGKTVLVLREADVLARVKT